MQRYLSGPVAFFGVMSLALAWAVVSLCTVRGDDLKDQVLYREAVSAVGKKDWGRASAALERRLRWRTEHNGAQSKETGEAYWYRGKVYAMARQHTEVIEAFRRPITIFSVDPGPRSKEVGLLLTAIADAHQAQGQGAEAIASLRQALEIFEVDRPVTATCLNKLSLLLLYRDAARFRQEHGF